ncbi:ENV1 protein, partial [Pteruthius melanotis]|nr:ENV1 protein [Pteruthius melanotis]
NRHICNTSIAVKKSHSWAIPPASGVWACQKTGVSPCISIKDFDSANDFCIQVAIVPRILYHTDYEMNHYWEGDVQRQKRELITGVTIAFLLGLGATGAATGVSALVSQEQSLTQLQMTIDEDLQRIEKSISFLEKSLSSLSEVVLQNRRGLDLLLMHQGGLCAALKEQCCFYANYSGVIRDSMAELRDRLAQRKREVDAQRGWLDSLLSHSPWAVTLISTLIGPIVCLLLLLMFGPCVLNKLTQFVKARLSKIDIMVLEQR